MKQLIMLIAMMSLFAGMVIVATPTDVEAQNYYVRKTTNRYGRVRYVRVPKPSYYRRHRNRINMALGTGGGALLGALLGGGKGALIGAGIGAGSTAAYTYKLNPKRRQYRKVR